MSAGFARPREQHLIELVAKDGATHCARQILDDCAPVLESQESTGDPAVHDP
jgi:hypothetical protein